MRITRLAASSVMALAICGATAVAQSAQQSATPADQKAAPAASTITVAGCVQKESAVLKRSPVATNAGMDDEFVLTFATLNPAPATTTEMPKPDVSPSPTGTSGSASNFGTVYRVTGDKENELKSYVGQRVEITGSFKDKDAASSASAVGTSGRDLTPANTPEITVDAIKPTTGTCAPAIK